MVRSLCAALLLLPVAANAEIVRFDNSALGTLPRGWAVAMTHAGAPPRWEIVRDESAPRSPYVLAQVSRDKTAGRFPLAIWDGLTIQDGEVSVAFKTVGGTVDRAAGIVWRFQDPNNYYIARANALENNVVLYKVANGVRLSIVPKGLPSRSYGVKRNIPAGQWNTLRVTFRGSTFTVLLNGDGCSKQRTTRSQKQGKRGCGRKRIV